jgi:adenine-specific DNA-methyltransferase
VPDSRCHRLSLHRGNRPHPTEKPVSALLPLIGAFSNEGDLVLRQLRRRFLGIKLDSGYHSIA